MSCSSDAAWPRRRAVRPRQPRRRVGARAGSASSLGSSDGYPPRDVPETIRHLTAELYGWIARGDLARVEVMFARHRQGSGATMERSLLFPVDLSSFAPGQPRLPPLHNLPPAMLLEKLIADYVFGLLTEAAIEALTSENAARFTATDSAHECLEKT